MSESIVRKEEGEMRRRGNSEMEKLSGSRFFYETPEKGESKYEMESSKYWTIEGRRKSLGMEGNQLCNPLSRNQFRKTTIMTKTIMRSNSNNYYDYDKMYKNEKLMENWRIKKKSLI